MNFLFNERKDIPKLSWCAILEKGSEEIQVLHGSWVEVKDHFFVEGIWDSEFSEGLVDKSCLLMGGGARINDPDVIFASPCHTLERLYYIFKDNKCYVSNSIAFVLAQTGLSPDINYLHYVSDFASICNGINDYVRQIPLENGHVLNLAYYQNLVIDKTLAVRAEKKPTPPQADDYASYRQFLVDSLARLSKNAGDADRRIQYSPLATISRGYDSTACAALAAETGCSKALTVAGPGKYVNDCGTDIAKTFGYETVIEIMVDTYKTNTQTMIEPLFMASGELGTDCFWASYAEHLPKSYVIIGINGDKVWDINSKSVVKTIKRSSPSATSLGEYRLQAGFVQVPVPFFGCVHHPAIHRISTSAEMKPWVLNNDYDRPIPRRIVEEKGVDRNQFANRKIGIGFNMQWDPLNRIKQKMSCHAFSSFMEFYKTNRKKRKLTVKGILQTGKYSLFFVHTCCNLILYRLGFKSLRLPHIFPQSFRESPFACSYLFLWGVHHTKKKYKI